jgi:ubiquinone/menaquinone biosynthesis C-methylase UbiE
VTSDFAGSTAEYYRQYRRDVPDVVLDDLCALLRLTRDDRVVDLGCGTGQVAVPLSVRVGEVLAVDPELDMLAQLDARITQEGIANVTTVQGADTDLPALLAVPATHPVAAVTVATALHWMNASHVLRTSRELLRAGGGVAVITQAVPIWLQDSDWARELRRYLQDWLGPMTTTCGTDRQTLEQRRQLMTEIGFDMVEVFTYSDRVHIDVAYVIGNLYSAISQHRIAPADRPRFERGLRDALEPHAAAAPLVDVVEATMLVGRTDHPA